MEGKEVKVNGVSENELIKVNIDKMEVTPMSFIVFSIRKNLRHYEVYGIALMWN